jgi:hypothetical protein
VKKFTDGKKNKETQLDLGLRSPLRNKLYDLKNSLTKAFAYLEVVKFLKEPLNWLFITLTLFLVSMQGYFIYTTFSSLPGMVPIFSYFNSLERKLAATTFIYFLPVISFIISIMGIRLGYRYFHKERVMSGFLLLSMLLSVILLTFFTLRLILPYHG